MPGRRRTKRFLLNAPVDAVLTIQHPVTVNRFAGDEMWITSDFPAMRNDVFSFTRVGSNPVSNFRLRVAESEPVIVDGAVRHRVRLMSAADNGPMGATVVGMLTKIVRIRLLDVSESGCLLESPCRLHEGAAGELGVDIDGEHWSDQIRVRHCSRRSNDSGCRYVTGAEFVWVRSFKDASLRDVVGSAHEEPIPAIEAVPKGGIVH